MRYMRNQRTIRAVEALRNNDVKLFGQLMNASHESLRYDYEVSCEEIDILVDLAQAMPGLSVHVSPEADSVDVRSASLKKER